MIYVNISTMDCVSEQAREMALLFDRIYVDISTVASISSKPSIGKLIKKITTCISNQIK